METASKARAKKLGQPQKNCAEQTRKKISKILGCWLCFSINGLVFASRKKSYKTKLNFLLNSTEFLKKKMQPLVR